MNSCDFLLHFADNDSAPALVDAAGCHFTYGYLRRTVAHLAGFIEQATAPQDRCLILAGSGFLWVAAYLAALKAGRIAVPVPSEGPADQLERILRSCIPAVAFVEASRLPLLTRLIHPGMTVVTTGPVHQSRALGWTEALACPPMSRSRPTVSDMLASLAYVTNAANELRGVMITHGNIIASVNALLQGIPLRHADRTLCMAPLSSCLGTSLLHAHLRTGASLVLRGPPQATEMVPEQLEMHHCTTLAGTPANYQSLLQQPRLAIASLPHLHCLQIAGAKANPLLLDPLRRSFRGRPVFALHGQAEAGGLYAWLRPDLLEHKPTSIGRGIADIGMSVLDAAGRPVLPGEVGRLVIQGQTVALGYWRDPAGSRRVFRGGQFHTGERARMDRDGDVYLIGQTLEPGELDGFSPLQCPVREVHYAALNFGLSEDSNATRLPFYWEEDDLREPKDHPR